MTFSMLVFWTFLFPDGRLPGPRWQIPFGIAVGTCVVGSVLAALDPTLDNEDYYTVANPIGIDGWHDVESGVSGVVLLVLFAGSALAAIASLVVRFRRSHGVERQQIKLIVLSGVSLGSASSCSAPCGRSGCAFSGHTDCSCWSCRCGGRRDPPLPALRRRRRSSAGRSSTASSPCCSGPPTPGSCSRTGGVLVVRRRLEPRDRRVDARGGGAVPASAFARAAVRRPALLPAAVRRAAHARRVRRAAAPGGRARDADRRPAARRRRDDAAGPPLALAPGRERS